MLFQRPALVSHEHVLLRKLGNPRWLDQEAYFLRQMVRLDSTQLSTRFKNSQQR